MTAHLPVAAIPVPVNMGDEGDVVYLILYGTGVRWYESSVTATVDGLNVGVAAVAHPYFVGLDQANIGPLPRTLWDAATSRLY